MEQKYLEQGINHYKTPLYVFDLDKMEDGVEIFRKHLKGQADICFAMKANPFLVCKMETVADRIEVCSMGEFRICKEQGILPEKLLISGVLKEEKDLSEILETYGGRCAYTIESVQQFRQLEAWCKSHHQYVQVYPRLTSQNQFGMDEETILEIIQGISKCPHMKFQGIHYFSGTRKKSVKRIEKELRYLDKFLGQVEISAGICVKELEYGPGLAVSYFEGQEDTMKEDIQAMSTAIEQMEWKGKVTLEMGRALAATCGYYLTSVKDIKRNSDRNYCIVDGGIHQINYDGQIRGMYQPLFSVSPKKATGDLEEWTVCGSLCTVNDVLMRKAMIQDLHIGDVLIFENTGAYAMTEGMSLFLSHELPTVAYYNKEQGWTLLRKEQQTYQWNMGKGDERWKL